MDNVFIDMGWGDEDLPEEFDDEVRTLYLGTNELTRLSQTRLPLLLKILDVSSNRIETLDGIEFPPLLSYLNLSFNRLRSLRGVQFPITMQDLNLSSNRLQALHLIPFPRYLERLYMDNNGIRAIPANCLPETLVELYINNNLIAELQNIPDSVVHIYANSNCICRLGRLPESLTRLRINDNLLTSLEGTVFPPNLVDLWMAFNHLSEVERMHMSDQLQILSLHNNLIRRPPRSYPESLRVIYLDQNWIESLDGVEFPEGLEELWLFLNQVDHLIDYRFPPALRVLMLDRNPLHQIIHVDFPPNLRELSLLFLGMRDEGEYRDIFVSPETTLRARPGVRKEVTRTSARRVIGSLDGMTRDSHLLSLIIQAWYVATSYRLGGVSYSIFDDMY